MGFAQSGGLTACYRLQPHMSISLPLGCVTHGHKKEKRSSPLISVVGEQVVHVFCATTIANSGWHGAQKCYTGNSWSSRSPVSRRQQILKMYLHWPVAAIRRSAAWTHTPVHSSARSAHVGSTKDCAFMRLVGNRLGKVAWKVCFCDDGSWERSVLLVGLTLFSSWIRLKCIQNQISGEFELKFGWRVQHL